MSRRLWVAVLLMLGAFVSPAVTLDPSRAITQYSHRAWRISDGLPNSVVRGIVHSKDGYLWVATYGGLARFDGNGFTRFTRIELPEMRRNSVLALYGADDGSIWAGMNGSGLVRVKDNKATAWTTVNGLPNDVVMAIEPAPDGSLWIGTQGGVCRFDHGHFIPASFSLPSRSILTIFHQKDGTLWIGMNGAGLAAVKGDRVELFDAKAVGSSAVYRVVDGGNGTLYAGTGAGLVAIRGQWGHRQFTPVAAIPVDEVTALFQNGDATWVGTYSNGLYRVIGDRVDRYSHRDGLTNNSVRSFAMDREGSLWVGTNGGVEQFTMGVFATIGVPEGVGDGYVRSVLEDHAGVVWLGTANGLTRIDHGRVSTITSANGLMNDYIFSLAEGPPGILWIGTPTGLDRYDGTSFTHYSSREDLGSNAARTLLVASDGTLWIGTDHGVTTFDGKTFRRPFVNAAWTEAYVQPTVQAPDGTIWLGSDGQGLVSYRDGKFRLYGPADGLDEKHIFSLAVDPDGTLWLGTDGSGLLRYRNGKFTSYFSAIPYDKVIQILDDGLGRLWIGTDRGILLLSRADLDAFADGKIKTLQPLVFGSGDGLRSTQCNGSAQPLAIKSRDGRLWFPTVDGVATIDSHVPLPVPAPPLHVVIDAVSIDGVRTSAPHTIVVPSGAKQVEIHYAALTYVSPEQVTYSYKLEGYDDATVAAGSRRVAYYTRLPPGQYTFRVTAEERGAPRPESAQIAVEMKPRFWQHRWFPPLVILMIVGLLLAMHLWRITSVRKREEELVAIVAERTRAILAEKENTERALSEAEEARTEAERHEKTAEQALAAAEAANRAKSVFLAKMSHELRTPLNAIIGFSEVLESSAESLTERQKLFLRNINSSGEHLLNLINDILDLAKIEAGKMQLDVQQVPVMESLQSVERIMRGIALPRHIRLTLDVPPDLGTIEADAVKFKQIVYNLLSNAVKFSSDGGDVKMIARRLSGPESPLRVESLQVSVADRGMGIAPENQQVVFDEFQQVERARHVAAGTGLGLALVKSFVQLHHGQIKLESSLGVGSTFTFTLPYRVGAVAAEPDSARGVA